MGGEAQRVLTWNKFIKIIFLSKIFAYFRYKTLLLPYKDLLWMKTLMLDGLPDLNLRDANVAVWSFLCQITTIS